MKTHANCKFCGKELWLDIDDDYVKFGDPFKLIRLAACNGCADVRERRRKLHEKFVISCSAISAAKTLKDDKDRNASLGALREVVEQHIKDYLRLIGDWKRIPTPAFELDMVEAFIERPDACGKHIGNFWRMARPVQQLLVHNDP